MKNGEKPIGTFKYQGTDGAKRAVEYADELLKELEK